jgi:hypothetical protein
VRVLGPRGAFWFGVFVYLMIAASIAGMAVAVSVASHSDEVTTQTGAAGGANSSSPPPPSGGYAKGGHASHDDDYYYYTMSWIDWLWGILVLVIFGASFFCILYDMPDGSQMMNSSYEPYHPPPWYQPGQPGQVPRAVPVPVPMQPMQPVPAQPVQPLPVPGKPMPTRPLLALKAES